MFQSSLYSIDVVVVLFATILLCYVYYCSRIRVFHRLPPGPPGEPVIGHTRKIPLESSWILLSKWNKKYGDIFSVRLFGRPLIVLGSFSLARELMEKRGKNYSDRPRAVMHGELMGFTDIITFLQYGEEHRRQRSMIQPFLSPKAVHSYRPLIKHHVDNYVEQLSTSPERFRRLAYVCVANIVIRAIYGFDFLSETDPRLILAENMLKSFATAGVMSMTLVDFIPFLCRVPDWFPSWFPGVKDKRNAAVINDMRVRMTDGFYEHAIANKDRSLGLSLVSKILEKMGDEIENNPEAKLRLKIVASVMYGAGGETSYIVISNFYLMAVVHPRIAKRAQQEIDAVTQGERMPTFDDWKDVPYIDCIIRELWRCYPPLPLGVVHTSREEDTINGMAIPAKSMIIPNIWHMLHDEKVYPDPETFNPDRFLPLIKDQYTRDDSEPTTSGGDPKSIVFGFGRRICPGIHLAHSTIWLVIASVLAKYDILPPLDPKTGETVIPKVEFISGFAVHPAEFRCRVVPRVPKSL